MVLNDERIIARQTIPEISGGARDRDEGKPAHLPTRQARGPRALRHGESVPQPDPGRVGPRRLGREFAEPSPGVGTRLEVEPLSGPTEASPDPPPLAEPGGEG